MNKVALVEDSLEDRSRFETAFKEYCETNAIQYELQCYSCGKDFLDDFHAQFDLLFMDIELPDADGVELCKKVRESDSDVVIAFLTNLSQYAIKGYEVDAIDFMLKPLVKPIFFSKMKKIDAAVKSKQSLDINLVFSGGKRVIRSGDIIFAEVTKHDLTFHTIHGNFVERYTLKELETKLSKSNFSRPNYCYLVNLQYVVSIKKFDVTLRSGDVLQISRNRKKEFTDDFARFLGGSI